ncbi:very short patch repair endonuclease [Massilia sp. UYP32]|uniref:very short patch repair endonuclease n=1 Tax=Massilia sp. UYP32 TaxID=1756386 RepID=UPI003D1B6190
MVDTRSPAQRRLIMSSVGSKNTGPEKLVRSLLHRLGYRFRIHRKDLPGTPDIVLPSRRKIIFVHGCFWHGHSCNKGKLPKSRTEFWSEKVYRNRARDADAELRLKALGWDTLTVWQCQLRDLEHLEQTLTDFLK